MSLKERLRNPFVQQYAIEILFPILGFYFFDWSLFIIGVFYLVDQLSAELVYFRRLWWINKYSPKPKSKFFVLESVLSFGVLYGVQLVVLMTLWQWKVADGNLDLDMGLMEEFIQFSIDELWFLFPMVVIIYHLKDTFTFYMPRRYLSFHLRRTINFRHLLNVLILAGASVFIWSAAYLDVNDHIILWSFIALKLGFDFTYVRWMNKKILA